MTVDEMMNVLLDMPHDALVTGCPNGSITISSVSTLEKWYFDITDDKLYKLVNNKKEEYDVQGLQDSFI